MSASASSSDLQLLFDPHLIPSSAFNGLTDDLTIRPLARDDHSRGHVQLLTILTQAPDLSPSTYAERFDRLAACPDTYYTVVFVHKPTDRVITSGTVFVERKFIRNAGLVGHIEDIAVDKAFGGRGLGVRLIRCLEELARTVGCYKTILDCSRDNIGFYEKCGFTHKEYEMVKYAPATAPSPLPESNISSLAPGSTIVRGSSPAFPGPSGRL